MEDALMEAKAALAKSKDEMAKYYDRRRTPAPVYQPGDKVYLDASDIQMTRPSQKLAHKRLGPFTVVRKVGNGAYRLCLLPSMSRLHPVFNIVKLTPALEDPIQGQRPQPPPLPKIIDGEEEWVVEEIWIVEWSTGNCNILSNGKDLESNKIPGSLGTTFMLQT